MVKFSDKICVEMNYVNSPHEVIIIGGGASGIASFSQLSRNKTDVLLLEAESRIGGRINSVKFGDNYVDLGGQWAHENALKDPIYKLAKDLGLLERSNQSPIRLLYSNRKEFPNIIKKFQEVIQEVYQFNDVRDGRSIAELAKGVYSELTEKISIPEDFPDLLEDMLEHLQHQIQSAEGALDWNQPSAQSDSIDGKSPYGSDDIDTKNKILLNKTVTKISWDNSDDTITIFCGDSTEYKSKKVIFTPSIGVLKSKMNEIFDPELPDYKKKAIKTLGIGAVVKVYLEFAEDWFNKHGKIGGFEFIWEKTMRKSLNTSWITSLSAILSVENNPNVLCVWFDGPKVPFIENLSDYELTEGIQFALIQFLGYKFDVPRPIRMIRSKWYTNANFLGTYSFQTVESRKRLSHNDLGEPLKNRNKRDVVFFAGEATSPVHYGTVHGAIYTGFREAENVNK
nr:probable polyamine oxidase 5 [Onthophagus taurus]